MSSSDPASSVISTDALISSISANAGIAGACIGLFSVIRLFWRHVYAIRAEPALVGKSVPNAPPKMTLGLLGWIRTTLLTSDEVFLRTSDLDALMFVRFMALCLKLFIISAIIGIGVILPVNYTAAVPVPPPPNSELPDATVLERLTLGNVPEGSDLMWIHASFAYLFTLLTLYFIREEYTVWLAYRHQWIMTQQLATISESGATATGVGGQLTVMFESVPAESGQTDDDLLTFFRSMYGDAVQTAVLMRDTKKLDALIDERTTTINDLQDSYDALGHSGHRPRRWICSPCCCGPCRRPTQVDAIERSTAQLNRLNEAIDAEQRRPHASMLTAFVTFSSSRMATWAAQVNHSAVPNKYIPSIAPNSKELYWSNMTMPGDEKPVRSVLTFAFIAFLVFAWSVPVTAVTGVVALPKLEKRFPEIGHLLLNKPALSNFLTGFLASVTLVVFQALLPSIVDYLARVTGLVSESQIQKWCLGNLFIFQVVNFFFGVILGNSLLGQINNLSFSGLPALLGKAVPNVSSFFLTYIALLACTGFPLGLLNPVGLVVSNLLYIFADSPRQKRDALLYAKSNFNFGAAYPQHLLVFLIGCTYAVMSPIVILFLAAYFGLGLLISRYSFLYIFINTFESGGIYWPSVASRLIASLFFSHITLIGVFSVKSGYYQSFAMIPLIVITYFFQSYVQERFPKFAEVLPVSLATNVDDILEQRKAQAREFLADQTEDAKSPSSSSGTTTPSATVLPGSTVVSINAQQHGSGHHPPSVFEYEHPAVKIIRATVDEDAEPKRLLSDREQLLLVQRAYVQPSLVAPNTITIVELTEAEKKQRAAEHVAVKSTNVMGGLKELTKVDFLFNEPKKRGGTLVIDEKEVESRRRQSSAMYAALGFPITPAAPQRTSIASGVSLAPTSHGTMGPSSGRLSLAGPRPIPVGGTMPIMASPGANSAAAAAAAHNPHHTLSWGAITHSFTSQSEVPASAAAGLAPLNAPAASNALADAKKPLLANQH